MEDLEKEKYKDTYALYSVVRASLNMSAGKVAAQVGHGVGEIYDLMEHYYVHKYDQEPFKSIHDDFINWKLDSFRKIVLRASEMEWYKILETIPEHNRVTTVDGGFTEIPPNTQTVITIAPMLKSKKFPILSELSLY